jgi:hypothetical protein
MQHNANFRRESGDDWFILSTMKHGYPIRVSICFDNPNTSFIVVSIDNDEIMERDGYWFTGWSHTASRRTPRNVWREDARQMVEDMLTLQDWKKRRVAK